MTIYRYLSNVCLMLWVMWTADGVATLVFGEQPMYSGIFRFGPLRYTILAAAFYLFTELARREKPYTLKRDKIALLAVAITFAVMIPVFGGCG